MLQSPVVAKARVYQKNISKSTFTQLEMGVKNELSYYLLFKILFSVLCEKLIHRTRIQAPPIIYSLKS